MVSPFAGCGVLFDIVILLDAVGVEGLASEMTSSASLPWSLGTVDHRLRLALVRLLLVRLQSLHLLHLALQRPLQMSHCAL